MTKLFQQQIGWMKCVACKDAPIIRKGQMHLGYGKYVTCPVCNGSTEVPKYNVIDLTTGRAVYPQS